MLRNSFEQTILNAVTPKAVTSSTDATPIVITATSHGFATGDRVLIYGHTTNVAANGIFKVTRLTSSTFSLQDEFTGADVAGTGAGAGASGLCMAAPVVFYSQDYKAIELLIITAGTATMTINVAGSGGKLSNDSTTPRYDFPNMGATVSKTNPYGFLQIIDLNDGSATTGSTGIAVAGTDICKNFEANVNAAKYVTVFPTAWTAGSITVKLKGYYV